MRSPDAASYAADTPAGLFTAAGTWYRTRLESLVAFAAPVATADEVPALLRASDRLVGAPRTLALWLAPPLLLVLPWAWAAGFVLVGYAGALLVLPALATPGLARLLRLLDPPLGQMLLYVFALSVMAAQEHYTAVWVGLALFVVLRWNLLAPLLRPLADRLYPPTLADRVLRALIVRTALQRGVALPEIQQMERSLLAHLRR